MINYEDIRIKKDSFFSGFSYIYGIFFYIGYTMTILTEHMLLRGILCLISVPVYLILAPSLEAYTEEEKSIITDVESARELIEITGSEGEKYNDREVNALVSLFRSRKKEMGWHKVIDILDSYDYDEDTLWQNEAKKYERKRLWENQSI